MDIGQSQKALGNVPTCLFWRFDKQFRTSFQKQESHQQEEKEKASFLILSFTSLFHAIDKKQDLNP